MKPPTLADVEEIAESAFARLPDKFRKLCAGLVITIEDFPDEETLEDMDCETAFDLLGLFHGTGLPQGGASRGTGQLPNVIWLYRRPILDYWAESEDTLDQIVSHVLVHEIGHHFGLSDEDMEKIEAQAL